MQIEVSLQPNCSELGLRLDEPDLEKVVNKLRKIGLNIVVTVKDKELKNVPAKFIAHLVKMFQNYGEVYYVPLSRTERFTLVRNVPDELKEVWLRGKADDGGPEQVVDIQVTDGNGGSAAFVIGDYCEGGDWITLETNDYEESNFPLLVKVKKKLGGEFYGIGGGHIENIEQWEEEHEN